MSKLKKLEEMLAQKKISRREFMKRATALGLAAVVSPIVSADPSYAAATPKKGGRLRAALSGGSTANTLDPALSDDMYTANLFSGVLHNYLTEINNDGTLIGELAETKKIVLR